MAIQVAYTDPATKLALPTAYVKILGINIDAVALTIDVACGIYASAAARTAGGTPLMTYHGWPPFSSITSGPVDIVVASYGYVKTLTPFIGSIDVA